MGKGMDVSRILGPSRIRDDFSAVIMVDDDDAGTALHRDWKCIGRDLSTAFDIYADDQPVADLSDLVARDTIAINPSTLRPRRIKASEE